jgi:heterodisulfide reductase subunit A-like polyferredoxin
LQSPNRINASVQDRSSHDLTKVLDGDLMTATTALRSREPVFEVLDACRDGGEVTVEVEDVLGGGKRRIAADLVVLATGMPPATTGLPGVAYDANGFATGPAGTLPVFVTGCAKKPLDVAATVQDATGVALKAIQAMARS